MKKPTAPPSSSKEEHDSLPVAVPVNGTYGSIDTTTEMQQQSNDNTCRRSRCPCTKLCFRELLYHLMNIVFGSCASSVVSTLVILGLILYPFCGIGASLLRINIFFMQFFAIIDVWLHNFVAKSSQFITLPAGIPNTESGTFSGIYLSPSLQQPFSKKAWVAILYFAWVKYPLALVSSILGTVPSVIGIVFIIVGVFTDSCTLQGDGTCSAAANVFVIIAGVCMLFLSKCLMHKCTKFSMYLTRTCLCSYLPTIVSVLYEDLEAQE